MKTYATNGSASCRCVRGLQVWALAVAVLAVAPMSVGAPPLDPLPAPLFSFDRNSPTVMGGILGASDVLELAWPHPWPIVPGPELDMLLPEDDLDALSAAYPHVAPEETFSLLFSIDRVAMGMAPPDPMLVALAVPFNPLDQAERGHAAGDQFMSTSLFARTWRGLRDGGRPGNANLVRNNFDEGGTDFSALPDTHAYSSGGKYEQDNVNATARLIDGPRGMIANVYFSATGDSPSLDTLPGWQFASGAHIFYNPSPMDQDTLLYAPFWDLYLVQGDDIDALIVFDVNENGVYDGFDEVLFSLAPGSPSLTTIPDASFEGAAADIFVASPGLPPMLFAAAQDLGLGAYTDNVDALDFFFCMDPYGCAAERGIRLLWGDLNCDEVVDFGDINPFVLALTDAAHYDALYPECDMMHGDCNGDGEVNFGDINAFVQILTKAG